MLGAIIGDIVGSIYEFDNIKTKEFPFFDERKEYTDDSILTIATADWLLSGGKVENFYLKYAIHTPWEAMVQCLWSGYIVLVVVSYSHIIVAGMDLLCVLVLLAGLLIR